MLVSVIVPNYNHAPYLKKRLESIYNQSYQQIEVILLDDASTDGSIAILEAYRENPKTKIIDIADSNSGSPFKQWQKGLNYAEGELIWIAESDDWADESLVEKLTQPFMENEKVVLSYCQSNIADETDFVLGSNDEWTHSLDKLRWRSCFLNRGDLEVRNYLVHKNTIPNASAVIFKKSSLIEIDERAIGMRMVGDWLVWCQILRNGWISYNPEMLNFFRTSAQASRHHDTLEKKRNRVIEGMVLLDGIKELVPEKDYSTKYEYYVQRWVRLHGMLDFGKPYFDLSNYGVSKSTLFNKFWVRYFNKIVGKKTDQPEM